ncbi:MAG: RsmD family RNA methyltransferase [Bacteroidota bacterium]
MTQEEFEVLASGAYESLLQDNLDQDPAQFALYQKENFFPPSVLATQLKYLQKSREKLPTFFENHCLFLPKAFEQASSEETAINRSYQGETCLDLTCGLGVDTLHFSKKFDRVVALESDPLLAQITQHNLQKLSISNVKLLNQRAEDFLSQPSEWTFDLIYVDPDRRTHAGKRAIRLEDCQPNVLELLPILCQRGKCILIKASPMLDLTEAIRTFPSLQKLSVVSVKNEVKEVLLELGPSAPKELIREIQVIRRSEFQAFHFSESFLKELVGNPANPEMKYIYEPDVAFYKARCTVPLFTRYFAGLAGEMNHPEGYFFSNDLEDPALFPGRVFERISTLSPQNSKLKRYLKGLGTKQIHVGKRHFPETAVKISRKLSLVAGGKEHLLFTEFPGRDFRAFHVRRLG